MVKRRYINNYDIYTAFLKRHVTVTITKTLICESSQFFTVLHIYVRDQLGEL